MMAFGEQLYVLKMYRKTSCRRQWESATPFRKCAVMLAYQVVGGHGGLCTGIAYIMQEGYERSVPVVKVLHVFRPNHRLECLEGTSSPPYDVGLHALNVYFDEVNRGLPSTAEKQPFLNIRENEVVQLEVSDVLVTPLLRKMIKL